MSFDMEMEDFEEDKVLEEYRKNVLITGVSSGLGKSLKDIFIRFAYRKIIVYLISII